MLVKLENSNKIALELEKCLRCGTIIELFKSPIEGETMESLIYKLLHDKELIINFKEFIVLCPKCGEMTEGSTFFKMEPEELELLNNTKINDILVTVI